MKKIGIIGGLGPEATIDYYKESTEFPLILKEYSYAGIPMLNTTKIHVDAIVKYCVG